MAGTPPAGITVGGFIEWQKRDQERMERELAEQGQAILEILDGAPIH